MDFGKYDFRLNAKACCLYEQLTGRNFFKLSTAEDLSVLIYSCLVVNNRNLIMTYEVFKTLIQDKKVAKWVNTKYSDIMEFNSQITKAEEVEEKGKEKEEGEEVEITMCEIASSLIVRHGMDAHYVMYDMDLWEIQPYLNAADMKKRADLVTQRFWTYMLLTPNLNTKKVKSPEELVPFDWEKDNNKAAKELEKNTKAAFSFLAGKKEE